MKIDDSVIDKVLSNQGLPDEGEKVAHWFASEEGNDYLSSRLDREMELISEEQVTDYLPHGVPEERMRNRFLNQIRQEQQPISIYRRRWFGVAAVLLPFVILTYSLFFLADKTGLLAKTEYAEITVPCGEQIRVVLQDGTIVQLNSDSRLKYPKQFGLFDRTVELWGEGYFHVAKEQSRTFKVDLQGVEVQVTGTKFNVKAYPEDPEICVTLEEGGILFKDMNNKEHHLVPGESAVYERVSDVCHVTRLTNREEVSAWRSNSLNFYLTPLDEILKVMKRRYDVHFLVTDSTLLKNRFTLSTEKVNVLDVLDDLEAVSNIRFQEREDSVFELIEKN